MMKRIVAIIAAVLALSYTHHANGADRESMYKYRFEADFQIKLMKGLKLNLSPEVRFEDSFDVLLLNAGLTYKKFGCIYFGANYRLVVGRSEGEHYYIEESDSYEYRSESSINHRFAFDVTYKDSFKRFTPSLRFRYNNYTEDDLENKNYLRYRAKVDYDIKRCKLTPAIFVEAFQSLDLGELYKMRYAAELDLKVTKHASMSLCYMADLFCLKDKYANILNLGYKQRF